jgi:N-acetylglutamate synthase-like GNAT family acetyltransferase
MNIRALKLNDLEEIKELHDRYYRHFEFPSFLNMLNAFVIEDNDGKIIMSGAVEKVAEAVLVTNKKQSEVKIGKALVEAQKCMTYTCDIHNIRDLYAFVDNDIYAKHLIQHGFIESDRALKLRIPHGQEK